MRSIPYIQRPLNVSSVALPNTLINTLEPWARSLLLGVGEHPPTAIPDGSGNAVFQFSGLRTMGHYTRRFALGQGSSIQFDLSDFVGLNVQLLKSTLVGVAVWAQVCDRELAGATTPPKVFLPLTASAGTQTVPWGATRFFSASTDPAFAWRGYDTGGVAIDYADPISAGNTYDVKAPLYLTAVNLSGLWEIQL